MCPHTGLIANSGKVDPLIPAGKKAKISIYDINFRSYIGQSHVVQNLRDMVVIHGFRSDPTSLGQHFLVSARINLRQ
jgi:hypothetical protein